MRAVVLPILMMFLVACEPAETVVEADPTASWALVSDDSRISFVSVKAGDIGETHYFKELAGSVSPEGQVTISVPLASVETNIDIRNERMRNLFFQVAQFPTATLTSQIDLAAFDDVDVGQRQEAEIVVTLDLHGATAEYDAKVFVTRLLANRVSVSTIEPLILSVDDFDLGDGLEELKVVAGLPSITPAVPVTASLVFTQ